MLMLLFGFIGLMLDLCLGLVWWAVRLALYVSPFMLLLWFFRAARRY